ncbi:MAG: carboxypeptidase-like regulatory domain-containing protein [Candidatus Anstonellales archaeon]
MSKKAIIFILLSISLSWQESSINQKEVCFSQCMAYHLAWKQDPVYRLIESQCSIGSGDLLMEMANAWAAYVTREFDFLTIANAWVCKVNIDTYIRPFVRGCNYTCNVDDTFYAPNLVVAGERIYYNERDKKLRITILNSAFSYLDSAEVYVYAGYDDEINANPGNMKQIGHVKLNCFTPVEPRIIPNSSCWYEKTFEVDWSHEKDMFNVVRIVAKPSNSEVVESSTKDNAYTFILNDLPLPPDIKIDGIRHRRLEPETNSFRISVDVRNTGEQTGSACISLYYGSYLNNEKAYHECFDIGRDETKSFERDVIFSTPYPDFITITLVDGQNNMVGYEVVYMRPQLYTIMGTVRDERGNAVENAYVYIGDGKMAVNTNADGTYIIRFISTEGDYSITAQKRGYFKDKKDFSISYSIDEDTVENKAWVVERYIYIDFVVKQYPLDLYIGYPSDGWYNINTNKGQYRGRYIELNATKGGKRMISIPAEGSNGTIVVTSQNCSALVRDFSAKPEEAISSTLLNASGSYESYEYSHELPMGVIKCMKFDIDDEYTPLERKQLVFEKSYEEETPHIAVFSKNGKRLYVLTVSKSTSICKVHSYDLKSGNLIYSKSLEAKCLGKYSSKLIPAYDGSSLYVGIGSNREGKGKGYILAEDGGIKEEWEWPEYVESLSSSSATDQLDFILESSEGVLYSPGYGYAEKCMLSAGYDCNATNMGILVKRLGLSRNRAIGECGEEHKLCIFVLNSPYAYILSDDLYNDEEAQGNYANDDVFTMKYNEVKYYKDGKERWRQTGSFNGISVSPGGRYLAISHEPYGIELFRTDSFAQPIHIEGIEYSMPIGMEATESGIYYAEAGAKWIKVYSLTNIVEPKSETVIAGEGKATGFIEGIIEAAKELLKEAVEFIKRIFGI